MIIKKYKNKKYSKGHYLILTETRSKSNFQTNESLREYCIFMVLTVYNQYFDKVSSLENAYLQVQSHHRSKLESFSTNYVSFQKRKGLESFFELYLNKLHGT